jgi:hypothetical protein
VSKYPELSTATATRHEVLATSYWRSGVNESMSVSISTSMSTGDIISI